MTDIRRIHIISFPSQEDHRIKTCFSFVCCCSAAVAVLCYAMFIEIHSYTNTKRNFSEMNGRNQSKTEKATMKPNIHLRTSFNCRD